MPDYPVTDVYLLLQSLACKAGVPALDKGGFDRISRQIRANKNPYNVKIEPRYLKERLYDRLKDAVHHDQSFININQAYIDTLSYFLGFNSFTAFQKVKNSLQEWLPNNSVVKPNAKRMLIIHHGKNEKHLKEIKQLTEHIEEPVMWASPGDETKISEQLSQASLILCALSDAKDLDRMEGFLQNANQADSPPVFLYNLSDNASLENNLSVQWQERPVLDEQTLAVALSILQTGFEDKKNEEQESGEQAENPGLKEQGAIIKHNHINGKYQNVGSGTYNLTITKNKNKW